MLHHTDGFVRKIKIKHGRENVITLKQEAMGG